MRYNELILERVPAIHPSRSLRLAFLHNDGHGHTRGWETLLHVDRPVEMALQLKQFANKLLAEGAQMDAS